MNNTLLISVAADSINKLPDVVLSHGESTYAVAKLILGVAYKIVHWLGLENSADGFTCVYAILVFLFAFAVGSIAKFLVLGLMRLAGNKLHTSWYINLREHNFFTKLCRIIPPLVFLILIQFTLYTRVALASWLTRLTWIYIIVVTAEAVNTFVEVMWKHFNDLKNTRKLPLRGIVQLIKGIVWIIVAIISVAILVDKSPASLLAGLGAFAAVLMLIFKDSILGVVAGVQLSENDSLHVGDWIKVSGTDANGTVVEVSLTAVKILNWDKTVTTVPPYNLVSGSFTNYRNMQQSHTRRIDRSYMIDADSVVPAGDEMLEEYARIPLISEWVRKKIEQRKNGKECDANNPEGLVDGSIDTNLGVFRAYIKLYLDNHLNIAHEGNDNTCFVTTLPQTSVGIPLQIYCFTNTSAWTQYEAIQASIFEHLAVMLYRFNLYTFENPSGRDTIVDGYMSPGKNPDVLFGLPYPFFTNGGTPQNPAYPRAASSYPEPSAMAPSSTPKEVDVRGMDFIGKETGRGRGEEVVPAASPVVVAPAKKKSQDDKELPATEKTSSE